MRFENVTFKVSIYCDNLKEKTPVLGGPSASGTNFTRTVGWKTFYTLELRATSIIIYMIKENNKHANRFLTVIT